MIENRWIPESVLSDFNGLGAISESFPCLAAEARSRVANEKVRAGLVGLSEKQYHPTDLARNCRFMSLERGLDEIEALVEQGLARSLSPQDRKPA